MTAPSSCCSSVSTATYFPSSRAAARSAPPEISRRSRIVDGERLPGFEALTRVGLEPIRLQAKEGLSLINGTQFMAAFGALGLVRARRLARVADLACAQSLEALQGSSTSFLPQIHALRPLRGQGDSAANVLTLLEGSAINEAHRWCDQVQDAYSLRCAPQVHGASRDLLAYGEATVGTELNAATDNPLVLVEDGLLVSNGNFHGQPLAFALDTLAKGNSGARDGTVELLLECLDRDVLPIVPSRGSVGASGDLAPLAQLAIELLAGVQGVEFLAPLQPGIGVRATREFVRSLSSRLRDDRQLSGDIEAVAEAVRSGGLVEAVEAGIGELR